MEENLDVLCEIASEAALLNYKQFLFTGRTLDKLKDRLENFYEDFIQMFDYVKVGSFQSTCQHKDFFFGSSNQELLRSDGENLNKFYYIENGVVFGNIKNL